MGESISRILSSISRTLAQDSFESVYGLATIVFFEPVKP